VQIDHPHIFLCALTHDGAHTPFTQKFLGKAQGSTGAGQTLPLLNTRLRSLHKLQKEQFHPAAGSFMPVYTRWYHTGIIGNQHIPWPKVARKIAEKNMFSLVSIAIKYHQARLIALPGRALRNQFRRQIIIEF
jgi:hypothetical protein